MGELYLKLHHQLTHVTNLTLWLATALLFPALLCALLGFGRVATTLGQAFLAVAFFGVVLVVLRVLAYLVTTVAGWIRLRGRTQL